MKSNQKNKIKNKQNKQKIFQITMFYAKQSMEKLKKKKLY